MKNGSMQWAFVRHGKLGRHAGREDPAFAASSGAKVRYKEHARGALNAIGKLDSLCLISRDPPCSIYLAIVFD